MPDHLGADADPASVDDLITQLLMQQQQQRVMQQYNAKVPLNPDGTPNYAAMQPNRTGRMPPDDVMPPEEVEGGTDTIDRNYY